MNMTEKTSKLTIMAMLCALAFVSVVAVRIPLIPIVPFLEYEPKDVVIVIGGFIFGPLSAALIGVVVSFVELLTISGTGIIGLIMNILSTVSFVCPAAFIYKKKHTIAGAVAGMAAGTLLMTLVMVLWNYLITPIYMGYPREAVAELLLPAFIPFNLIKGAINTALTLLIYKPLVTALRKSHLLVSSSQGSSSHGGGRKMNVGVVLTAAVLLATCILVILVMQGKL